MRGREDRRIKIRKFVADRGPIGMMGPVCACVRRKSTCDSKVERDVTGIEMGVVRLGRRRREGEGGGTLYHLSIHHQD